MQCCKYKKYTAFVTELDMSKINCIICLNDLGNRGCSSINDSRYKKNCKCAYMVHRECFKKWFDQNPKCLICMGPVVDAYVKRIKYTVKFCGITLLVCIAIFSIYIIIVSFSYFSSCKMIFLRLGNCRSSASAR
jgi:hypothetical protein